MAQSARASRFTHTRGYRARSCLPIGRSGVSVSSACRRLGLDEEYNLYTTAINRIGMPGKSDDQSWNCDSIREISSELAHGSQILSRPSHSDECAILMSQNNPTLSPPRRRTVPRPGSLVPHPAAGWSSATRAYIARTASLLRSPLSCIVDEPEHVVEHKVAPLPVRLQLKGLRVVHGPLLGVDLGHARSVSKNAQRRAVNTMLMSRQSEMPRVVGERTHEQSPRHEDQDAAGLIGGLRVERRDLVPDTLKGE